MRQTATPVAEQDPRKRQTILDHAIGVFAQRGFRSADVQEIADLADVGKGTVYRYFGSKEGLFLAAADAGMKALETEVLGAIKGVPSTVEEIRRASRAYARFFQRRPEMVEILIQERAEFRDSIRPTNIVYREKNRGFFEDLLRAGIVRGELRPVNVRDTSNAIANLLYGTIVCGCLEGSTRQLVPRVERTIEIFLQGVLANSSAEGGGH